MLQLLPKNFLLIDPVREQFRSPDLAVRFVPAALIGKFAVNLFSLSLRRLDPPPILGDNLSIQSFADDR